MVEKILAAYIRLANKGERLGELINRLGLEEFRKESFGSSWLTNQKDYTRRFGNGSLSR